MSAGKWEFLGRRRTTCQSSKAFGNRKKREKSEAKRKRNFFDQKASEFPEKIRQQINKKLLKKRQKRGIETV